MSVCFMRAPVGAPIASQTEVESARDVGVQAASSAVTDVVSLPSSRAGSLSPGGQP